MKVTLCNSLTSIYILYYMQCGRYSDFCSPIGSFQSLVYYWHDFWHIAKSLTALFFRNKSSSLVSWSHTGSSHSLFPGSQCCFSCSRLAEFLSCHISIFVAFAKSLCLCWIKIKFCVLLHFHSTGTCSWSC